MTTTTTNNSLDEIGRRIDAAYERTQIGHQEWVDGTLELAQALAAGRASFPSNIDFGVWCVSNGHDQVNGHDRAALINMAADLPLARIVLEETKRASWQHIWINEMQNRFAHREQDDPQPAENGSSEPSTALAPVSTSAEVSKSENPAPRHTLIGRGKDELKDPSKAQLVQTLGVSAEDYAMFFGSYPANRQRALRTEFNDLVGTKAISRKKIRQLFAIGVSVVNRGCEPKLSNFQKFDASVFLPHVPVAITSFMKMEDLVKRVDLLERLDARAVALATAGISETEIHTELLHLWEHGTDRPTLVKKALALAPGDSKERIRHEVKFCGETIWPREGLKHVTYQDMNAGWHLIHHWCKYLEHARPQKPNEIAVQVQHLIQDLAAATSLSGLADVMLACMSAYNKVNGRKDSANLDGCVPPGLAR
jgi:hypothetical protein